MSVTFRSSFSIPLLPDVGQKRRSQKLFAGDQHFYESVKFDRC